MWPDPQETADLVLFTKEIFNCKLLFLCSVFSIIFREKMNLHEFNFVSVLLHGHICRNLGSSVTIFYQRLYLGPPKLMCLNLEFLCTKLVIPEFMVSFAQKSGINNCIQVCKAYLLVIAITSSIISVHPPRNISTCTYGKIVVGTITNTMMSSRVTS